MIKTTNIAILLATYNGERFLREQLDSILQQTNSAWDLFIHDDGSTDNTNTILADYQSRDKRVHVLSYPSTGGACANFMSLLQQIDAPYYMFCDQDDVWLPNKVELEYQRIQALESNAPKQPIVVITDLQVVDSSLRPLCNSFHQFENIHPEQFISWYHFAKGNIATGCTMLFNNHAKSITLPISKFTLMHDAWITLCVAANNGIIDCINQPTILYRQHGNNALGAQDASRFTISYRLHHLRQMFLANKAHFQQMNVIRPISIIHYWYYKLFA